MRRILICSIAFVACADVLHAKGSELVLSAPREAVFDTALETIAGEYRVEQVNKESGTISFRTGMSMRSWGQDGSCIFLPIEDGRQTKVICNTEKRGHQLVAWGEGGKIQKKVFKLLTKALFQKGLIPKSELFD